MKKEPDHGNLTKTFTNERCSCGKALTILYRMETDVITNHARVCLNPECTLHLDLSKLHPWKLLEGYHTPVIEKKTYDRGTKYEPIGKRRSSGYY